MDERSPGERRTRWVVLITLVMMTIEIAAGTAFGSMALLADGWHMGTHAAALGMAFLAYGYARRHAHDPRYTFGTGKVTTLAGFASAVGLAIVAAYILFESMSRLASPREINFDQAIFVAVIGLLVNIGCALVLNGGGHEHHGHHHDHGHGHDHTDHNLRAAYLHVVADALTSVLAIISLIVGSQLGWVWMDPLVGVVGAAVIARWSIGLMRSSAAVLLDAETPPERYQAVREALEQASTQVTDLHIWRVGPQHLAASIVLLDPQPEEPQIYRARLRPFSDLQHTTIEVNTVPAAPDDAHPQMAAGDRSVSTTPST